MAELPRPKVVLSGVNLIEAGPLAVMQDALYSVTRYFPEYEVHALVHRADLFSVQGVIYHEHPRIKNSWLRRILFEYVQCMGISRAIKPCLWFAMHDMTPRVEASKQAVYCHNPSPFYRMGFREALLSYKLTLFSLFYQYLYGVSIRRNDYVIVQQNWLRDAFLRRYRLRKQIVVAHPSAKHLILPSPTCPSERKRAFCFFYPAFPRSFKNMEVLLEACRLLEEANSMKFELRLTIDGTENKYSSRLRSSFSSLTSIRWLGALPRQSVMQHYADSDALLFPSKLETWGMPLTEFKETGKPIFAADLPYAHETVGTYPAVCFLPPNDPAAWAQSMQRLAEGRQVVQAAIAAPIDPPFARSWKELFSLLLIDTTDKPCTLEEPEALSTR